MYQISKKVIEQNYRQAILDYQTASNQEEKEVAMHDMAEWERTAGEQYGFVYMDELAEMKNQIEEYSYSR